MDDSTMNLLFVSDDGQTGGFDTTGDGQADMLVSTMEVKGQMADVTAFDSDANGVMDFFRMEMDTNGDGIFDTSMVAQDYDQDGNMDFMKFYGDTTGTGDADTVLTVHRDNMDPDVAFRYEFDIDTDMDHVSDMHYEDVIADDSELENLAYGPLAMGSAASGGTFDPETPSEYVVGEPATDMESWEFQGNTNRCALFSQKFAIEQITGQDIDIESFADIAEENGWFSENGGTTTLNMDKMLDYYDIDHEMQFDASLSDLEDALRNGDKVIVSVDSGQIWYGEANDIFSPGTVSDHALQVVGIDYSNPDAPMAVLNDSGSPAGCGEMVPLDIFENAWAAGDHQMIVCHA